MFSKKATQIDEIFTVDTYYITVKISSIFVAFLKNMNFKKILPKLAYFSKNVNFFCTVLAAQTDQKAEFRTTKSLLM